MSVMQDLLNAADIMEERGYCKGTPEDSEGRVCALGAIRLATSGHTGFRADFDSRTAAAINALARHLSGGGHPDDDNRTVWKYNDGLGWRAQKKMVKTLREAARV